MSMTALSKTCKGCGNPFDKKPSDSKKYWSNRRFCSIPCSGTTFKKGQRPSYKAIQMASRRGSEHPNWKGGRYVTKVGYVTLKIDGKNILEHRHVMEKHLGRKLHRREHVHHINGDKADNRMENLELMDIREHNRKHTTEPWSAPTSFRQGLKNVS